MMPVVAKYIDPWGSRGWDPFEEASLSSDGSAETVEIRVVAPRHGSTVITHLADRRIQATARLIRESRDPQLFGDVLDMMNSRLASARKLGICKEDASGSTCCSVPMPSHISKNILAFLRQRHKSQDWNCLDFVKAAHGMPYRQHVWDSSQWNTYTPDITALQSGDALALKDRGRRVHFAIYLYEDHYLSKYGACGALLVSSLAEMQQFYKSDAIEILRPRGCSKAGLAQRAVSSVARRVNVIQSAVSGSIQ